MAKDFYVVLMTAPRGKAAAALARGLVSEHLAACVNIIPSVVSHYRWRGRLHRDAECLLVAKTSAAKWPAFQRWIKSCHPYTTPELLALKVDKGSRRYLDWLAGELK